MEEEEEQKEEVYKNTYNFFIQLFIILCYTYRHSISMKST